MTDQTPKKEQAKPARGQKKDDKKLPDYYARVVVVPIANPETAPELLELAKAVVERDGGGRIIALAITLSDSDAESNRERLDELEALVEKHKPQPKPEAEPAADAEDEPAADADEDQEDEGEDAEQEKNTTPPPPDRDKDLPYTLEFVTRTANAIARGILDQARENGAELILVGVQQPKRGEVALGTVVQAVLSAAPCDVLVYRYSESPYFDRIVVPVDGTPPSRMAVRMGIIVANAHKHCPVEAIHVLPGGTPEFEGRARIAQTLEGVPGRGIVKQTVVRGYDAGSALLSRTDEDQLIIMGFAQHNDFEKWLYDRGKSTREVLNKAPGPVMIAVRNMETVTQQQRVLRRAISWLRPRLTDIEQEQVVWDANSNAGVNLDYVVLMLVSATLASLG
ncbi:MAG: universal stress protein, partial [Chloroflexota bacterium]